MVIHAFGFSLFLTVASILLVTWLFGWDAGLIALILIAVEVVFSFDNAIINARVLERLSAIWQKLFLTIGAIIAVFGMRLLFPLLLVAIPEHDSIGSVVNLALHHPGEYAAKLASIHVSIAAFGGAFLLTLALQFFLDDEREELWLERLERSLQRFSKVWLAAPIAIAAVLLTAVLPSNDNPRETITAGILGVLTFTLLQLFNFTVSRVQRASERRSGRQRGQAAFVFFLYLQILDASFSFDSVIGAFAITDKIILIFIGLGIGALWVRSLTVYVVQNHAIQKYKYLDHGAHYAILVLAIILLISTILEVPDMVAGVMGVAIIITSLFASKRALAT